MKDFFKIMLATIVGFIVVNILSFIVVIMIVGVIAASTSSTTVVKENSILTIDLSTPIVDRASQDPLDNVNFLSLSKEKTIGLNTLLQVINHAKTDKNIDGIYIKDPILVSKAFSEEIRAALADFKQSGKFIYSYTELAYSQDGYFLSSVADKVLANSEIITEFKGLASTVVFYKDLLKKVGLQPEIIRVGKFKAAVEPFIEEKISDANREQISTYLNSIWGTMLDTIAQARNISVDSLNAIANNFSFYTPEQMVQMGLYDSVMYNDEFMHLLADKTNKDKIDDLSFVSVADYATTFTLKSKDDKIAVIFAEGEIGLTEGNGKISPKLIKTIRDARMDDDIKAIVFRVNSPGGSAMVSDQIWREVKLASDEKPLIVSMGNYAASGGYYISCPARKIVADPMTITGSIGIFGMFFSGEDLINNKLALKAETVKTNEHSDFGGAYPIMLPISNRPFTPYERNVLQNYINHGYDTFLSRVMQGRNMSREQLDAIAQGRVWTGADAIKIGLVDQLGGLEDAIVLAANEANLSDYSLVELPKMKTTLEYLIEDFSVDMKAKVVRQELGTFYPMWDKMNTMIQNSGVMMRLPYEVE